MRVQQLFMANIPFELPLSNLASTEPATTTVFQARRKGKDGIEKESASEKSVPFL